MKNRILVVEDDTAISELICMNLTVAGYDTEALFDGKEVEALLKTDREFDLALLDVMLPGKDGFELMELMKEAKIPVIYLTAQSDVGSKITGLRSGAEDYIVKPFEVLELLVRVEKVLERTGRQISRITVGTVEINLNEHQVTRDGQEVSLKPLEYDLLVLFLKHQNVALSRDKILMDVWECSANIETRTVDNHVQRLRKKLGLEDCLKTVFKVGYRLENDL